MPDNIWRTTILVPSKNLLSRGAPNHSPYFKYSSTVSEIWYLPMFPPDISGTYVSSTL